MLELLTPVVDGRASRLDLKGLKGYQADCRQRWDRERSATAEGFIDESGHSNERFGGLVAGGDFVIPEFHETSSSVSH